LEKRRASCTPACDDTPGASVEPLKVKVQICNLENYIMPLPSVLRVLQEWLNTETIAYKMINACRILLEERFSILIDVTFRSWEDNIGINNM
jgi:hypothetical protein